jgi:hypothetical protein
LVEHLRHRVQEQNRRDAEIGPVLAETDARGAKATIGYGSTLALPHGVAHLSLSAGKKLLDRARAQHSAQTARANCSRATYWRLE